MIRCTIVETTAQGGETASRVARATVSETLTLGRAAACKIYLPAPQVRLEHASIRRAEDGYLLLEGIGGAVLVDGRPQALVRLAPDGRLRWLRRLDTASKVEGIAVDGDTVWMVTDADDRDVPAQLLRSTLPP